MSDGPTPILRDEDGYEWSVVDGLVSWRWPEGANEWHLPGSVVALEITPRRIEIIARLTDARAAAPTQDFEEWFVANYPPGTIISKPEWHASRIARQVQPRAATTSAEPVAWMVVAEGNQKGQPYRDEDEAEHAAKQWTCPHRIVPLYASVAVDGRQANLSGNAPSLSGRE